MGERLDSWKEIAAYLRRDVRTVQRWALGRSLPVHHLPGGGSRPRVFASKAELDGWVDAGARRPHDGQASVAVLPLASLAGATAQHFADGLSDDIINELVRIPGLRVTARTSSFAFRDTTRDVREIGARLGVGWLVEGSVRRSGRCVRVSAQLVSAKDGFHAWSDSYDRQLTDVFAIQAEIARSIAVALQVTLTPGDPPRRPTDDPVAYDLWVKGRTMGRDYTPSAVAEARKCYDAAIARDPLFARPWFGLAELLFQTAQFGLASSVDDARAARRALTRALELDDLSGEAHALSGVMLGVLDYAWPAAEAAFRRALELSPGSADILLQHAWFHLVPRRRIAEAVEEAERAVALDPLSPLVLGRFALVLIAAGQHARALQTCRAAVRLAPRLWWLRWFYATALLMDGRPRSALREANHVFEHSRQPALVGSMALLCGRFFGMKARAKQLLAELEAMAAVGRVPEVAFAQAYLGLGDDRAFESFGKAIDARDPTVILLPSMPLYDGIRGDPRFDALLARMNLA